MTHDELLARIELFEKNVCLIPLKPKWQTEDCKCMTCVSLSALRAVVKLITKEDTIPLDDYHFGYMAACKDIYEAIEKELR